MQSVAVSMRGDDDGIAELGCREAGCLSGSYVDYTWSCDARG